MFKQLIIASALLSSLSAFAATEKVQIDTSSSKVVWLGKKVTGQHTGEVKLSAGQLEFDGAAFKAANFTVDMTTITCTDLTDAEYNKKLIGHLSSDDFFATDKNKTAQFVTKSVSKVKDNTYKVTGDLTIKGKTAPASFNAEVTKTGATAVVSFDRTTYDIKYNSGKFFQALGDKMIEDSVQLTVNLTVKK